MPLLRALLEGVKTALLAVVVYLVALPFLLFAGFGVVIFFLATAFLLGREYFELAAMRYRSPAEAKRLRKDNQGTVFIAGLFIAAVRVDPDRQSRDAAVRHGVHGAHAQAAGGRLSFVIPDGERSEPIRDPVTPASRWHRRGYWVPAFAGTTSPHAKVSG